MELASAQPPQQAPWPASAAVNPMPPAPTTNPSQSPNAPEPTTPTIPAQIVRRTRVAYPTGAAPQRIEGIVELSVVVRADGKVKEVRVVKGNPYLGGVAAQSVKEWLYEPAYFRGKPVESEVPVIVNFRRPQ